MLLIERGRGKENETFLKGKKETILLRISV